MTIRGIIFDFGGVFNRQHESLVGFETAAQRFGRSPQELYDLLYSGEEWQLAKTGKLRSQDYWRRIMTLLGMPPEAELQTFFDQLFEGDVIDQQVVAIARALHRRYPLALLSNATDDLEELLATRYRLADLFKVIVNSATAGIAKPDPGAYQLALDGLGLPAGEALFIDDKPRNVEASRALGIPTIHFTSAAALAGELAELGLLTPEELTARTPR